MFLKYFITPNAEQHYFTERESEQRTALFILRREKERSFYLVRATGRDKRPDFQGECRRNRTQDPSFGG